MDEPTLCRQVCKWYAQHTQLATQLATHLPKRIRSGATIAYI